MQIILDNNELEGMRYACAEMNLGYLIVKKEKSTTEIGDIARSNVKKHCTIVIAWDSNGVVQYCRTFDYKQDEKEKIAAQCAFSFVSQNFPCYVMSEVGHYLHLNNFKEGHS